MSCFVYAPLWFLQEPVHAVFLNHLLQPVHSIFPLSENVSFYLISFQSLVMVTFSWNQGDLVAEGNTKEAALSIRNLADFHLLNLEALEHLDKLDCEIYEELQIKYVFALLIFSFHLIFERIDV